jgi:hypothetical protein
VISLLSLILQNPPTENQDEGQYNLHWAIPAISPAEKYFLSQLISSPTKEVQELIATARIEINFYNMHFFAG